jgi:hypothetical protein
MFTEPDHTEMVGPPPGRDAKRVDGGGRTSLFVQRSPDMAKWQYHVETVNISDRWSLKRQRDEVNRFRSYLNEMGNEGWEMISYESVPLTGSFTGNIKGYAYLTFFKRQAS